MSGEFRPEQNNRIESTDDADLARNFGLTDFNRETGLYTAPKAPDAGQRDGEDVQEQRRQDAHAEGERQQQELDDKIKAATEPKPATKATGSKASQSKDGKADAKDSDSK